VEVLAQMSRSQPWKVCSKVSHAGIIQLVVVTRRLLDIIYVSEWCGPFMDGVSPDLEYFKFNLKLVLLLPYAHL
jgi:uncharacterized membrane protein YwaF